MIGRTASLAAIVPFIFSFALLSALTARPANAATDPAVACAVAKQKAATKEFSDKVKCHGTALKKGVAVDPACLTKVEAKFDASFAKAEAKGGCVTTGDAPTIETIVDDTLVTVLESLPSAATDDGIACAVAKQKAATKKFSDKVKCHGTALKKGVAVDPACLTKVEAKFDASFAKAEAKGGCATTGDAPTIETIVDDTLVELLLALPSLPPTVCPEDGGPLACTQVGFSAACGACCLINDDCNDPCNVAVAASCSSFSDNDLCAAALNAAGCAEECCQ